MNNTRTSPIPDFFVSSTPQFLQSRNEQYCYNSISSSDYFNYSITSVEAAEKYPHSYSLIAVDSEDEYGVSIGRLLYVASSLEDIDWFLLIYGGFKDEQLHYVTGAELS
jgi:hypothetical protein